MTISPILFIALICLASVGSLFPVVEAVWLTVPTTGQKCVYEEIQANVLVILSYFCIDESFTQLGPTVDLKVQNPIGTEIHKAANMTYGEAAFTTSISGAHMACLSMHHDQSHHSVNNSIIVNLEWKLGFRTKDWDSIAKKEKIEGVELSLKKSTEMVNAIMLDLHYLKLKEEYMRDVNEKTNKRVAQLSLMSLGLATCVSAIQVWHLKRFFLKKKLI